MVAPREPHEAVLKGCSMTPSPVLERPSVGRPCSLKSPVIGRGRKGPRPFGPGGKRRREHAMSRADEPHWLRCQHTIRKLLLHTGKDALVYAQSVLEKEASEPDRLRVFWENARKFFEEYDAKS